MDMHPPTNAELHFLAHIILTSNARWNPSSLTNDKFSCDNELALDAPFNQTTLNLNTHGPDHGKYMGDLTKDIDIILNQCQQECLINHTFLAAGPNLELMRLLFGWVRVNCIKRTIAATTQLLMLLFVCLSACISNHAFPLAMFIIGMKMLPLIYSSVILQLMMMESLVMPVLIWLATLCLQDQLQDCVLSHVAQI
jgi:hypothetical protein